jgi:hypothetical protein
MEVHMSNINLVGSGVDTLILNVLYCDSKSQPIKQELDEKLQEELDYLQSEAQRVGTAVARLGLSRCPPVCRATWSGETMAVAINRFTTTLPTIE